MDQTILSAVLAPLQIFLYTESMNMHTHTLKAAQLIKHTYTNEEGDKLYIAVWEAMQAGKIPVLVDFSGIDTGFSSSFLNSWIHSLVNQLGYENTRAQLKCTKLNRLQAEDLKEYYGYYEI